MGTVLIIGAGGVGGVAVQKCLQLPEVFSKVHLASRTLKKCELIQGQAKQSALTKGQLDIHQVDADDVPALVQLINTIKPKLVINLALPYQDLHIMDACLETGVNYLDTANYEPIDEAKFEYKWQWDYQDRFKEKGLMALLGSGFDPGVTNVFCAYAQKHWFDEIHKVDILDCNGGDHGHPFATNFNPEINIREITQKGRYWENGKWIEISPMSVSKDFDFPEVGIRKMYLLHHEEMESLVKHLKGLKRIRFWMTFGEAYINHLQVLQNVGMTRIDPINYEGHQIVPLQFLKAVLPEPSELGENYSGKTCIGCIFEGLKEGQPVKKYVFNICSHQEAFKEVRAQAVSYTTGVPAMIGAKMILEGKWKGLGVFNMEQFDPDPFMEDLNHFGLPWTVKDLTLSSVS